MNKKVIIGVIAAVALVAAVVSFIYTKKTADPATVANTPQPAQVNNGAKNAQVQPKEVSLDKAAWKDFNIFFSNFSEAEVPAFEKDKLSNKDLILFGIHHIARNDSKLIDSEDNASDGRLDQKYVEQSVNKYFGKGIKNETVFVYELDANQRYYCTYKGGYYTIPGVPVQIDPVSFPGGEHDKFSQITKLIDNGNGTFTAYVNVYAMQGEDAYLSGDPYSTTPEEWKKNNASDEIPYLAKKMKATIKKEADGRYIMIDYLEDK